MTDPLRPAVTLLDIEAALAWLEGYATAVSLAEGRSRRIARRVALALVRDTRARTLAKLDEGVREQGAHPHRVRMVFVVAGRGLTIAIGPGTFRARVASAGVAVANPPCVTPRTSPR